MRKELKDILNTIETEKVLTIFHLLAIRGETLGEFKKEFNTREHQVIKNLLIVNVINSAMNDPRKAAFSKFYLEAYDRLFFVDRGVNTDNDGIVLQFINDGDIEI